MKSLILKPGREKSLLRRHPWVFSGAVATVRSDPAAGETVAVFDGSGNFIAWAGYSPNSQIVARVWSWDQDEQVGRDFFERRFLRAIDARRQVLPESLIQGNAVRLVHGESDGLPGLILDCYDQTLVIQILSAGAEYWQQTLVDLVMEITGAQNLYERSDVEVRKLEGLAFRTGLLAGPEPPETIRIREGSLSYLVDVRAGHKTGFYLDQRNSRALVANLAAGRDVLDCFCYTGGFGIACAAAGARSITSIDASVEALAMLDRNRKLNKLSSAQVQAVEGDVFRVLREYRDRARTFDLIILDPPKFAPSANHIAQAARGYKDINLLAFKLLRPGGILITFSCSGGINMELFQKIIAGAALDAGQEAQIQYRLFQSPDHPVSLYFPEGAYLKGLVLRVS